MSHDFCRQIDEKMLVEEYVAGRLKGDLLKNFERHMETCEKHAQAVMLEKALRRGISEYARSEIKSKLKKKLEQQNDVRFLMLRYAAILFIVVITPLLIYYQFNVIPQNFQEISALQKEIKSVEDSPSPTVHAQEESESRAEEPAMQKASKKSIDLISRGNKTVGSSAQKKDVSQIKTKIEKEEEQEVPEVADIAYESANEVNDSDDSPLPVMPTAKARPGSMLGARGNSINIRNHYAELQEMALKDSTGIKECIEMHLESQDRADYFLLCKIQVTKNGEIGLAEATNAPVRSQDLENCLISIIKSWKISSGDATTQAEFKISYNQIAKSDK